MYGKWLAIPKWKMTALILNEERTTNEFESDTFDVKKKLIFFSINSCYSFNIHTVFSQLLKGRQFHTGFFCSAYKIGWINWDRPVPSKVDV